MENKLVRIVAPRAKRLGHGIGSGKGGHTSSRGQKGQKTRAKISVLFEGLKVRKSFIKRLPFLRGKDKFKAGIKPIPVSLSSLEIFKDGETINLESLIKTRIVDGGEAKKRGVKILNGKLTKKLKIELPLSKGAAKTLGDTK